MLCSSRRIAALLTGLAAVGLAVVAVASPAQAVPNRDYVALGDSYAAGFGLPAPAVSTGQPVPGCAQTSLDYPHRVATAFHLQLHDVTCSGAVTDDFFSPQATVAGTAAPQLDVFKTVQPGLVTITIGGNDLGFTRIFTDCVAATANGPLVLHPTFSSCSDYYGSTAADGGAATNPYSLLSRTAAKVQRAIAAVRAAAPQAKVVVIAYPAIQPDKAHTPAAGCFNNAPVTGGPFPSALPITNTDTPYLQHLQQRLDRRIGEAAAATGASYADIYPSSLAHSACSPESTRWVEPLLPGGGGTNYLHPSIAGAREMAIDLIRKITYP